MTLNMRDVIHALATHLNDTRIGVWPGPNGTHDHRSSQPLIFAKNPPRAPQAHTAYILTAYQHAHTIDPSTARVHTVRIQILSRAPRDADPLGDAVVRALHGQHRQEWNGLAIDRCKHVSTVQLGADSAGLDERTDNFEITITTH